MSTDRLRELIARKRAVLESLQKLTSQQANLIDQSDVSSIVSFLSAKQHLIEEMLSVEKKIDPFRQEDPEARIWVSADVRKQAQEDARVCELILSEVLTAEEECVVRMSRRRDETAGLLESTHSALMVHGAYLDDGQPISRTLDLSSEK